MVAIETLKNQIIVLEKNAGVGAGYLILLDDGTELYLKQNGKPKTAHDKYIQDHVCDYITPQTVEQKRAERIDKKHWKEIDARSIVADKKETLKRNYDIMKVPEKPKVNMEKVAELIYKDFGPDDVFTGF